MSGKPFLYLPPAYLLNYFFDLENGGDMFLRNVEPPFMYSIITVTMTFGHGILSSNRGDEPSIATDCYRTQYEVSRFYGVCKVIL
jgi:hypothetical protein